MTTLSLDDLRGLAARHGISDVDTAAAIAMAESGGNPGAHGDLTLGQSLGLWQINLAAHPEYKTADDPDGSAGSNPLYDPDTNADAMNKVSSAGSNWQPWSTYTSGAYKQYMPDTPTSPAQVAMLAATSLPSSIWGGITSLPAPVKIIAGAIVVAGGLALAFPKALRAIF